MPPQSACRVIIAVQCPVKPTGNDRQAQLFDFGFFELDMLAHDGVIFAHHHFFGDIARVLFRHIEKARIGGADKPNFNRGWFRHGMRPSQTRESVVKSSDPDPPSPAKPRPLTANTANVKHGGPKTF
jgi:hypothetical protein